jgi:hypothetical protein
LNYELFVEQGQTLTENKAFKLIFKTIFFIPDPVLFIQQKQPKSSRKFFVCCLLFGHFRLLSRRTKNNIYYIRIHIPFSFLITIYQNIIGNIDQLFMSSYIHKNYCLLRIVAEKKSKIKFLQNIIMEILS